MGYELKQVRKGVFELVFVDTPFRPTPAAPVPMPTESLKVSNKGLVSTFNLTPKQLDVARAAALKRLMRDFEELKRNPLPTVSAAPLESNIFEWHGNLLATSESPMCGLVFHIIMVFPDTYPLQPPSVRMMNDISHPNIFGSYICLDMLETGGWSSSEEREQRYTGWSTAYTVTSVLIQMQNFLSEHSRDYGRTRSEESIKKFVCGCGHKAIKLWPLIRPEVIQLEIAEREAKTAPKTGTSTPKPKPKPTPNGAAVDNKSPVVWYGLFRRHREESFPFRLPELKGTSAGGSNSAEAVIRWCGAGVQKQFHGLVIDTFAAERGFTVYEMQFAERAPTDPFHHWGEVYPTLDLHNIRRGLDKLGLKLTPNEVLAQKEPFRIPAKADKIEFRLSPQGARRRGSAGGGEHRMTARYNMGVIAKNMSNQAWQMVAVDESNGKNMLVLSVVSNGFDAHFVFTVRFYLHSKSAELAEQQQQQPIAQPAPASKANVKPSLSSPSPSSSSSPSSSKPAKSENAEREVVREERPPARKYVAVSVPLVISSNFGQVLPQGPALAVSLKKREEAKRKESEGKGKEKEVQSAAKPQEEEKNNNDTKRRKETKVQKAPYEVTFYDLPPEMQLHIFSFLEKEDLFTSFNVNAVFADLALGSPQWGKEELVCFHSKRTAEEDTLGIPINFALYPKPIPSSRPSAAPAAPKPSYNNIESITSPLDLLSYQSYTVESVRRGVWKELFTHWLPLYVSREHGKQAVPLCEQMISFIMTGDYNRFEPVMAVEVFTKLMNTMIVSLMSGATHASEKAMEGYFSFHHWLLVFIERYPQLLDWINKRIEGFIKDPEKRIKKVVPSLGEFIPLLAVTDKYQWKDVAEALILEVFDRNQKWVLQKYPALGNMDSGVSLRTDKFRLIKTFEASQVSMRLVLFHAFFLNTIAKPKGRTVSLVRRVLDACYGRPSPRMKVMLQNHTKQLQRVDNWVDFFVRIEMPLPTPEQLTRWLRQSVWNSSRKRYHNRHAYVGATRKPRRVGTHRDEEEKREDQWD